MSGQLPPLRPTSGSQQNSADPHPHPGPGPEVTFVIEKPDQVTNNEKKYITYLNRLKDLWLRIYALEEQHRKAQDKSDNKLGVIKAEVHQLTKELQLHSENNDQKDPSVTPADPSVEDSTSPVTPSAMYEWEFMFSGESSRC
ncbi:hypothetical protein ACQRIT_000240 [Beauveria bassiana]|uniref:Uncharacterized protein n=1 Tax=Beauveria bassiana D1-5 TaxID=1245745 RepID=A0A0A2V977_BEABA|nr:hypothetical protein BBAD15_g11889 [Beauveria bassiana D1-5]